MTERLEKQLGTAPATFPSPIFTGLAFVSWFRVSPPPLCENASWGIYIGVYRSTSSIWDQDRRHRRYEAQTSLGGAARPGARTTWSRLALLDKLVCFFFSCWFLGKNNNARKILAPFEFWKVSETKKYTKLVFHVPQSYNPHKGDRWKIPINQCKSWL
jgi:hypothetical protein